MKKYFFAVLIFCLFSNAPVFAQKIAKQPDLSDADAQTFKRLKLETKKNDASIYQAMGMGYFEQGVFDKAFFFFNKASRLDPKLYWSWYYLGLLKMEAPENYFKKAIEVNATFAPPYYWLGRYYCKAKKVDESARYFKEYVRLAKDNFDEGERVRAAEYFLMSMESGETDYDTISKKAPR